MASTYFFKAGPIDDFIKFLPRSKAVRFKAFSKMYSAPSVLIRFSDIFSSRRILFFFRGMEMISAPLIPISLSYSLKLSKVLFCRRIAARQRAPSIPNEFFLIDPSSMPKFSTLIWLFLMNSSKMRDSPTSLIILLARFRCYIFVLPIKFLIACMPYSLMELSARLSSVKLKDRFMVTCVFLKWLWASWWCWLRSSWSLDWGRAGTSLSLPCLDFTWTSWPFRDLAFTQYLGSAKRRYLLWDCSTCMYF